MRHRQTLLLLAAALLAFKAAATAEPIQLHVDLVVDPAKEHELIQNFRTVFRPAISRQPGFVDVKLLKLRTAVAGAAPTHARFRLLISFQNEQQRQKWVASEDHQKAWPAIEKTLTGQKFSALLYDVQ